MWHVDIKNESRSDSLSLFPKNKLSFLFVSPHVSDSRGWCIVDSNLLCGSVFCLCRKGQRMSRQGSQRGQGAAFSSGPAVATRRRSDAVRDDSDVWCGRPCMQSCWDVAQFSHLKWFLWFAFMFGRAGSAVLFVVVQAYDFDIHEVGRFDGAKSGQGIPSWAIGIGIPAATIMMFEFLWRLVTINLPVFYAHFLASVCFMVWSWLLWFGLCDNCASGAYSPSIMYIAYWFMLGAISLYVLGTLFAMAWGTEPLARGERLGMRFGTLYRQYSIMVARGDAEKLIERPDGMTQLELVPVEQVIGRV